MESHAQEYARAYLSDHMIDEQSRVIEWLAEGPQTIEAIPGEPETALAEALHLMVRAGFVAEETRTGGHLYRFVSAS